METLSLNPIAIPTAERKARQSKNGYFISPTFLLFLICLLGSLVYGLTQIDALINFYTKLMVELGQLELLLRNPNLGLQ